MTDALERFRGKRVHILGIGGTLMGAFAVLLKKSGIEVTGSDGKLYPPMSDVLKNAEIEVFSPFDPAHLEKAKPDLVIVGNVIRKVNPEMEAVVSKQIPFESLPSALENYVLPQKHPVVICGTHGKTTTSSMMAWILECLGETPSFFVGGVTKNFPESFKITNSKYMVLEGDEYDTAYFDKVPKFSHYLPMDTILTSVEYDHADIYPDMKSLIQAFDKLADITNPSGFFIVCSESEAPLRVSLRTKANVVTYGFQETADSLATNVVITKTDTTFLWKTKKNKMKVVLKTTGKHNVLNALACLTWAELREKDLDKVVAALYSYDGVKRRQEVFAQKNQITLIDDFAHHPTAVRETLMAIRSKYSGSRILACFEPRSATSRKKVFQAAYVESFDSADQVFISKPYDPNAGKAAEQTGSDLFSTEELIADLKKRGKPAKILDLSDRGIKDFRNELRSGDVVLVMSNGSFEGLLPKLSHLL